MRLSVGIRQVNIYYSVCADIAKETFNTLKKLERSF